MFHTEITFFNAQCIMHNAQLYVQRGKCHTEISYTLEIKIFDFISRHTESTENTEIYSLKRTRSRKSMILYRCLH